MSALHAAGETFAVPCFAEQTWGDADTSAGVLTATVTSVAMHDDLSTLYTAQVPDEWRALVGADGSWARPTSTTSLGATAATAWTRW